MTSRNFCKICSFMDKASWCRDPFLKEIAEASSLRQLCAFLRGQGLRCSPKTVAKHIERCVSLEVRQQRLVEIQQKKEHRRKLRQNSEFDLEMYRELIRK